MSSKISPVQSTRILLVQHMFDKKHIHVGVIRKKKDFAKSKLSGDASFEAFVAKKAVDVQKLQGLEASLDKLRASRQKEPASGESNLSASQEVMATYLSILSESPEICKISETFFFSNSHMLKRRDAKTLNDSTNS